MDKTTNIANALTATGITVFGVATGLSYEVLLAGFAGGLVSLSFLPMLTLWRRIWTPFVATLTAGYTAPAAAHWVFGSDPSGVTMLLVPTGFIIGVLTQTLIPAAFRFLQRKADGPLGGV